MFRFSRYLLVGGVATAAHYLFLLAGVELAGWAPWLASGAGAVLGAQVAYLGNRHYTFASTPALKPSWLRFQITAALGALLGMGIVRVASLLGLHYLLGQVVATGAGVVLTYAINSRWSFQSKASPS
ncbi:MAG TPA: GtrA family protein [Aquabacterium sp.]|nr:GtrA family protein [Aquabacterium sp.]